MATIQQNNINFTNVQADPIFGVGGKFSRTTNNDGTAHFNTTLTGDEIDKSFNSLEIDWNGAQIELNGTTYTINTTGELISLILEAAKHKSINSSVSNQTITMDNVPTTLTVDQYGHLINVQ